MTKSATLYDLSRTQKATITRKIHGNLVLRAQQGPAEPGLDAFVPKLDDVATRLADHVHGKDTAAGVHAARSDRLEKADVQVDTYCRHHEGFLENEAIRRSGPFVESTRRLYAVAFPRGRAFLDEYIPTQNAEVRRIIDVLRAPEHQDTLKGIEFPMAWIQKLEDAVVESEAAFAERALAIGQVVDHVSLGRDAEADAVDVLSRLRKYVDSRTPAGDAAAEAEARVLMAPLTEALAHTKAVAQARKTNRAKEKTPPVKEPVTG